MKNSFPTERLKVSQNFQFPSENEVIYENPPTFIWIPVDDAKNYTLTVFDGDEVFEKIETSSCYANLTNKLSAKEYSWTVETDTGLLREKIAFTVSPDAIDFERPSADEVFDAYPVERPSYIFSKSDIPTLLEERKEELEAIKKNVAVALPRPLPAMPTYHHKPYSYEFKLYFCEHRLICDRDLIACALLYALTGDEVAGKKGVELLLKICDLNPHGPCSVDGWWDDETGISNVRCLPPAFDMLYPLLSERLRGYVASIIAIYAGQCENKLKKINYEQNPSNSHAGRVPAYLGGAALVLKGIGHSYDSKDGSAMLLTFPAVFSPFTVEMTAHGQKVYSTLQATQSGIFPSSRPSKDIRERVLWQDPSTTDTQIFSFTSATTDTKTIPSATGSGKLHFQKLGRDFSHRIPSMCTLKNSVPILQRKDAENMQRIRIFTICTFLIYSSRH